MQNLQHEQLAVACQAFNLVSFLLCNGLRAPVQWEEIHYKEVHLEKCHEEKALS
jgi:hypothetical protein